MASCNKTFSCVVLLCVFANSSLAFANRWKVGLEEVRWVKARPGRILAAWCGLGSGDQALADHEASAPARSKPPPARSLPRFPVDRWAARSAGSAEASPPAVATSRKAGPLESPAGCWPWPSEGQQCLQLWVDRHCRGCDLLLEQHLGRQLSQPRSALAAERQIFQHLPGELLQLSFAGQRGHGRAPRRTPQPAGGGSRARPQPKCGAQRSQCPHRRARFTLDAPSDHGSDRSGARSGAGGCIAAALLTPHGV